MGVELSILQRIELTISSSPDKQTFVTRARSGPRCRPGRGLDSAETTVAWTRPSVCSLTSRHRLRRLSTFWAWTGSLWVGMGSAVGSGMVQRAFAPGLAHMMSSGSGPLRLEEKGTLKDRLTWVPGAMTGGAEVAVAGRLIGAVTGSSWLEREKGKPAEGVIFSQPCRAEPVKFDILCIVVAQRERLGGVGWRRRWWVTGRHERKCEESERDASTRTRRPRLRGVSALDWLHTDHRPPPPAKMDLARHGEAAPHVGGRAAGDGERVDGCRRLPTAAH
jgi:hypothetical protein